MSRQKTIRTHSYKCVRYGVNVLIFGRTISVSDIINSLFNNNVYSFTVTKVTKPVINIQNNSPITVLVNSDHTYRTRPMTGTKTHNDHEYTHVNNGWNNRSCGLVQNQ